MQYDFLKKFPRRMKNAGLYAVLTQNIVYKVQRWKDYNITGSEEQINLVFAVLLFLMENSLKEQYCTVDDIAVFIDNISTSDFNFGLTFDQSRELADFIVNSVLSNDGVQMQFEGYDFEEKAYSAFPVRYVTNEIVYLEGEVKRTSYHLTDDGYSLLLSTLEIESNMRLTIQELLFQMQMEKRDYDKAVDTVKEIFDNMRRQIQRIRDAMVRVRRNALNYSVAEYDAIIHENLESLKDSGKKFEGFRELTNKRKSEINDIRINDRVLTDDEVKNLKDLGIIGSYLDRVLEEHQKILNSHFELKALYSKELENMAQVSQIRRFSLREKLYEPMLKTPALLGGMDTVLAPLFRNDPGKSYNLLTSCALQRPVRSRKDEDETEELDFDEEAWEKEQERIRLEKTKKYKSCLSFILTAVLESGSITLSGLKDRTEKVPGSIGKLIPDIDTFKEIMVELLKSAELDIEKLREEQSMIISDADDSFEPNVMILELLEKIKGGRKVKHISIVRYGKGKVVFENIEDDMGRLKAIRCSDVKITLNDGDIRG